MTDLPQLTESDIRRWVGEASSGRGQRYFRQGHILDPRRQGDTLKARCLGSRPQPYHVEVTLGPEGVVAGECSCPVGGGGRCKHTAALLLTWLHEPDTLLKTLQKSRTCGRLSSCAVSLGRRPPSPELPLQEGLMGTRGFLSKDSAEVRHCCLIVC